MAKWANWVFAGVMLAAVASRGGTDADAGREAIGDLDWSRAIRVYAPLAAAAAPGTDIWTKNTFCLAVAYQQVQPPDAGTIGAATQLFQSIIDKSKDQRFVARSLMNLGRIAELKDFSADPVDLPEARKYYRQVIERFPATPIASEAALREGAAYVLEYDAPEFTKVKEGVALLEKYALDHPNDTFTSLIWQTAGDAYFMPLNDQKNALHCYEMVDRLGWSDQGNQGPWYWRCARIADAVGDRTTAIKYYTKIVKETPNSGKGYAAVLALRRFGAPVPRNPLFDDPATTPQASTTQEVPR